MIRGLKRAAGFWGPLGFAAASVLAARRLPGYSHRRDHISGLAAHRTRSARIMVPGFLTLAAAHLVASAPTPLLQRITRIAGITTLLAGAVRVSDPRCPQPGVDPDADVSDIGHGAASITTFVLWTAMPIAAATSEEVPAWYRRVGRLAILPTLAAFTSAGLTTRFATPNKGVVQRVFLGLVLAFFAVTVEAQDSTTAGDARAVAPSV